MADARVIIFDMFNTLMQDAPHHWEVTFNTIIKEQQLDTTVDILRDEWRSQEREFQNSRIQPGRRFQSYFDGWRGTYSRTFQALGLKGDPAAASRKSIQNLGTRPPFSDTIAALNNIKRRWRVALLSNADDDFLQPAVANLGVTFEDVLSSEQAGCYKPIPELFQKMLTRLKVRPAEAVYVGDRQFEDIKGATDVGMRAVWINRFGAELDPALPAPDVEVTSLLEIPDKLGVQYST